MAKLSKQEWDDLFPHISKLLEKGYSKRKVAKMLGMAESTLRMQLQKRGFTGGSEVAAMSLKEAGAGLLPGVVAASILSPMVSGGFDVYNQFQSTGAASEMVEMQTPQSLAMRAMLPREEVRAAQAQQALMSMLMGPQGPALAPGEVAI